jgi:hypothetical protein
MPIEEMFTSLPTVTNSTLDDIICAVQGFTGPTNLGLSTQQTLQQIYNLFQSNIILFNAGNPNGVVAGTTFTLLWDTVDLILWVCTTTGTSSTSVWTRADINSGYATTVTAASTTTLTVQSPYWQFFTGTTTQTVVMPVVSTLATGITWSIVNNSTGIVTVQSSGFNTIIVLAPGELSLLTCILTTGTSAASWNASVTSAGGGVASITGTANEVIASSPTGAVNLSLPQAIATTSTPTFGALTLSSPLTIPNGGTSVVSVTTTPTVTSFAGWDANKNLSANNFIPAFTTTVSSATPIVLTVASTELQYITGSTAQTVTMPVTSTLVAGMSWTIVNLSSATTTVNSSGANAIISLPAGSQAVVTCILNSGTTAASWSDDFSLNVAGVASITGTANEVIASSPTGAVNLSLPQAIAITSNVEFGSVAFSSTNGIIGTTTNNNASAGSVGEFITAANTTGTGMTSGVTTNITSISLTAGDWDVEGQVTYLPSIGASMLIGGSATTSSTLPGTNLYTSMSVSLSAAVQSMPIAYQRYSLSATTTIFLVSQASFSSGSCTGFGSIYGRRVR